MTRPARVRLCALVFLLAIGASCRQAPSSTMATDEEIVAILKERIDTQAQGVGMVVGIIEPAGRRVVTYGAIGRGDARALDGDTVFEIGSVTKVFTSLLLAEAVERGEARLDEPIASYLPASVNVPERAGRKISLHDLATHTSGLPRLPGNIQPKDVANPYADYSIEQLYRFLSSYELTRDVGARFEYSNLGVGLLGLGLARRAGMDYEALLRSRVLEPLDMESTGITLSADMRERMATGHAATLQPTAHWEMPTLVGAGALRSSANDLLTFLEAVLGYSDSPLAPAMALMTKTRRPLAPGTDIGLAWQITTAEGKEIVWHNGGTGGFWAFIAYAPSARTGVVVLSNAGIPESTDDIGRHLLDPHIPLRARTTPHDDGVAGGRKAVAVDAGILDGYVGRYQLTPAVVLTVTRKADRLFVQLMGQDAFEIFAETEKDYFLTAIDAQITFETDTRGRAAAVVVHQNGQDQRAPRVN